MNKFRKLKERETMYRLRPKFQWIIIPVAFLSALSGFNLSTPAATIAVRNTLDSGADSLRQAILDSNDNVGNPDTIVFEIPGAGPHLIEVLSLLPVLTDPVTIDGYTQGTATPETDDDAIPNSNPVGQGLNTLLKIRLNGFSAGLGANGLEIAPGGSGSVIRGLVINAFGGAGIRLTNSSNNRIEGNFIGTDAAGTSSSRNLEDGILIANSSNNTIGGLAPAARNLISGNGDRFDPDTDADGIEIRGPNAEGNLIQGNLIGTNAAGSEALPNGDDGIDANSASNNAIGGTDPGAGNTISGNGDDGVEFDGGQDVLGGGDATGNILQGNIIGADATGRFPIGNLSDGVDFDAASGNLVGGLVPGARNIISGNLDDGIELEGMGASGNTVQGNFIGTDIDGAQALGNFLRGIGLEEAPDNLIGGTAEAAGNVISANLHGISIGGAGATGNVIQGNRIGTDSGGVAPLGNQSVGILIGAASGNTIGGAAPSARNILSSNLDGLVLEAGASGNLVQGNFIGTDASGSGPLGNRGVGVEVLDATANVVSENMIAYNDKEGVLVAPLPPVSIDAIEESGPPPFGPPYTGAFTPNEPLSALNGENPNGAWTLVVIDSVDEDVGNVRAFSLVVCETGGACVTFGYTGPAVPIPDGDLSGVEIPIVVSGFSQTIADVNFRIDGTSCRDLEGSTTVGLDHTYVEDLTLILVSPEGTPVTLISEAGGEGNNFCQSTLDDQAGVFFGTGNALLGNSIFANGELGIDLSLLPAQGDGRTPGDVPDTDEGPNNLQNSPELFSFSSKGSQTSIQGSLTTNPNTTYRIEFFASPNCDPSGYGEGRRFLGSSEVVTSVTAAAVFDALLNETLLEGDFLTATATVVAGPSEFGDTSEFSACLPTGAVPPLECPAYDFDESGFVDAFDLLILYSGLQTTDLMFDISGNGVVDDEDLLLFSACWRRFLN